VPEFRSVTSLRSYSAWVLVERDDDGNWISYCPQFDTVSYGKNPLQAVDSVCEAVGSVLEADLKQGLDPLDRKAPEEVWERLALVLTTGKPLGGGLFIDLTAYHTIATQAGWTLTRSDSHPISAQQVAEPARCAYVS
jgi:hypothetical protein